jgi:hypothetical protein
MPLGAGAGRWSRDICKMKLPAFPQVELGVGTPAGWRRPALMARGQFLPLPGRLVKGADEHYDVIEAVIAGDPVVAKRINRDHFLSVIAALRQLEEVTARQPASHSDHGQSRSMPPLVARRAAPFSTSAAAVSPSALASAPCPSSAITDHRAAELSTCRDTHRARPWPRAGTTMILTNWTGLTPRQQAAKIPAAVMTGGGTDPGAAHPYDRGGRRVAIDHAPRTNAIRQAVPIA